MPEHEDLARREALWDEFLQRWPLESLASMSLDAYTRAGDTDCFTYWVETRVRQLGSIQGNTALKFGIYAQSAKAMGQRESSRGVIFAGGYGWRESWGQTPDEAFRSVRQAVVELAQAARQGQLERVESSPLSPMYKWKLAFLYQNRQQVRLLPIYSTDLLRALADDELGDASQLELNSLLLQRRGNEPVLEFARRLWTAYEQAQGQTGHDMAFPPPLPEPVALNRILYGPPGTGKTYAAIEEALAILDPDHLRQHAGQRAQLKQRFDQLAQAGRVRLVTFHQSFSYEDFVEGLRAVTADEDREAASGTLQYRVEPGVFRQLCSDAMRDEQIDAHLGVREGARIWKLSIDGTGPSPTREHCLQHGEARIGWGHLGDLTTVALNQSVHQLGSNDQNTLHSFREEVAPGDVILCIRSAKEVGAIGVVTGPYRFEPHPPAPVNEEYCHVLPVTWLASPLAFDIRPLNDGRQFTLKTLYPLPRLDWATLAAEVERSQQVSLLPGKRYEASRQPCVLIIDEINRGNISRIFGELLTLIEPSKRAGAPEALSVTLPYSRLSFSVPANVYLLGTMNTADRSLAGLDVALRRRFTFKEMPPQPDLLAGVEVNGLDLGELLAVMNERIEVLLDRDHTLGHAYFMPLKVPGGNALPALAQVFRQQVLPLLQEYFFADWERIRWVLNDQAKAPAHQFVGRAGRSVELLFGNQVGSELTDRRWHLNPAAFERMESYLGILPTSSA